MKKKMHPTQLAYAKAKAIFDTINPQYNKELIAIPDNGNDDELIDAMVAIDKKYNCTARLNALHQAEQAMVAWNFEKIKNDPVYGKRYSEIARIETDWRKHPHIRAGVIDLAFKLAE